MTMAMEWIRPVLGSVESFLLAIGVVLSLAWQCLGLASSRQWSLLPLAVGLSGLAVFLLNPLADSTSLIDLQSRFTRGNGFVALCTLQLACAAASFWLGIHSVGSERPARWEFPLGLLHSVPVGMVLLGALFIEQQWLARQVGARPEWVGLSVAVGVASLLLLITLMLALVPPGVLRKGHLFSALWMGVLAALLTSLDRGLPNAPAAIDPPKMIASSLAGILLGSVCLAIGFAWERYRSRNSDRSIPVGGSGFVPAKSTTSPWK